MIGKRIVIVAAGLVLAILAASCSDRSLARPEAFHEGEGQAMISAGAPSAPAPRSMPKAASSIELLESSEGQPVDATAGRKLVFQASMDLEALDLPAVEAFLDAAVQAAGGYVSRRNAGENSIFMQVRVPVTKLEGLMAALAGQGRILGRSLSAEDVTDRYFDLEGRLRNKRLLEARYRQYLGEARTMEELLNIENKLSEVTNDIEWLEGTFRELGKRIELATLSVSIRSVYTTDPARPTLGQSLHRLLGGFGEAVRISLVILAGLVLYGIPAILALAGIWWLAFGSLGLVRRLFALAGRGRKNAGTGS